MAMKCIRFKNTKGGGRRCAEFGEVGGIGGLLDGLEDYGRELQGMPLICNADLTACRKMRKNTPMRPKKDEVVVFAHRAPPPRTAWSDKKKASAAAASIRLQPYKRVKGGSLTPAGPGAAARAARVAEHQGRAKDVQGVRIATGKALGKAYGKIAGEIAHSCKGSPKGTFPDCLKAAWEKYKAGGATAATKPKSKSRGKGKAKK